jgi:hypothetical protein
LKYQDEWNTIKGKIDTAKDQHGHVKGNAALTDEIFHFAGKIEVYVSNLLHSGPFCR